MEQLNSNLVEAIRELNTIVAGAVIATERIAVVEGDGVKVPVAILSSSEGATHAVSLVSSIREAYAFAESKRLEKADGPDKRHGQANLQALESFIEHANRFKAPYSAVWADAALRRLVSVLDYHPVGAITPPKWGKHRGLYPCPLSEAWVAWGGGKALLLEQDDFAALLDGRDRELASGRLPNGKSAPDPSALITLANNLEVFSNASAKRMRDPNTGRLTIAYAEEKGVSGDVIPPPSFLVLIPVFQDAPVQLLEVRLKVTVEEGKAKFSVQIHAAGDVLREAFSNLCDRVRMATELPVFLGTPE